jgi:hypothetical protein
MTFIEGAALGIEGSAPGVLPLPRRRRPYFFLVRI